MAEVYGNVENLIALMNEYGVEFVFFNPGIDNVPVLETLAAYAAAGKKAPRSILCLDEFVAMTAAHGAWMASGRPQVVSVHSELGIMQIGGALHNAQWGKAPIVFFTEIYGPPGRTNWRGDAFDQAATMRNFVKYDRTMQPDDDFMEVFRDVFRAACAEPCGPVYAAVPREALWSKGKAAAFKPGKPADALPETGAAMLDEIAKTLLAAAHPLIVTGYAGRNAASVAALVKLAEALGAGVVTADTRMNFPNTHPLAVLTAPDAVHGGPVPGKADVILAIDYDMHYTAPLVTPMPGVKIIHVDCDTAKKGNPLWGQKPFIQAKVDSSLFLPALLAAVKKHLTAGDKDRIQKRAASLKAEHEQTAAQWDSLAKSQASRRPVSPHWLTKCINDIVDEDTVIVNQVISYADVVAHQIKYKRPGMLLSCAGGCIGWALGAALGARLAAPEKTVIGLMGDGAFVFGCPEASLWASGLYQAPFLAVIYDNRGYGAIKGLFRENYGVTNMGADIAPPPDYTLIARASSALGLLVEDPTQLPHALRDGLAAVRRGQTAVIDVRIEPV